MIKKVASVGVLALVFALSLTAADNNVAQTTVAQTEGSQILWVDGAIEQKPVDGTIMVPLGPGGK